MMDWGSFIFLIFYAFKICNPLRLAVMQCEIPRTVKKHVEEGYDKYVKTNIRKVVDYAKDNIYFRVVSTFLSFTVQLCYYYSVIVLRRKIRWRR